METVFLNITQNSELINKKIERTSASGHDGFTGTVLTSLLLTTIKLDNIYEAILLRPWIKGRIKLQFLEANLG